MPTTDTENAHAKINAALDMIRPYLQADGGDISFVELTDDMIVKVRLLGACSRCDISLQTLKLGVETTIQRYLPEVVAVEAV